MCVHMRKTTREDPVLSGVIYTFAILVRVLTNLVEPRWITYYSPESAGPPDYRVRAR